MIIKSNTSCKIYIGCSALLVFIIDFQSASVAMESTSVTAKMIWKKGGSVSGNCRAIVKGELLMDGPCSGAGHGNSVFVTAKRDGCSIEMTKTARGVVGKIFAYKDSCGNLGTDVSLGVLTASDLCWNAASVMVCLKPDREL